MIVCLKWWSYDELLIYLWLWLWLGHKITDLPNVWAYIPEQCNITILWCYSFSLETFYVVCCNTGKEGVCLCSIGYQFWMKVSFYFISKLCVCVCVCSDLCIFVKYVVCLLRGSLYVNFVVVIYQVRCRVIIVCM